MTLHKFFLNLFLVFFSNLLSFQELEVYTNEDHDTLRSCRDVQKSYGFDRAFNWASMKKISKFIFEKKIKIRYTRRGIQTHNNDAFGNSGKINWNPTWSESINQFGHHKYGWSKTNDTWQCDNTIGVSDNNLFPILLLNYLLRIAMT